MLSHRTSALLAAALAAPFLAPIEAAVITKADNNDSLSSGTSWVGGVAPTSADIGLWDSTVSGANESTVADTSTWGSIRVTDPGGTVGIRLTANRTLTLASGGVDASAATQDVNLVVGSGGFLRAASANFNPNITVASGRTVTVGVVLNNQGNTKTFTFDGGGDVIVNSNSGGGGAMNFNITGGTSVAFNNPASSWTFGSVSNGTLSGVGALPEIRLFQDGVIAPGNSIGTLTIADDGFNYLDWHGAASGVYQMAFELSDSDNTSDKLIIGDPAQTNSYLTKFTDSGTFFGFDFQGTGAANQTYTLVEFTTLGDIGDGVFTASDFSYTNLGAGLTGEFTLTATSLQFTTIPEPASLALVGLGGLAVLGRRRS